MGFSSSFEQLKNKIKSTLPIEKSFDLIFREITVDKKRAIMLFINGFINDSVMVHIMRELQKVNDENKDTIRKIFLKNIPCGEVSVEQDFDKVITDVLSGMAAFFIEGENSALVIDIREFPAREPSESLIEKVTRGARDDFVETIVFNTALVRRRIRDPKMTFEIVKVGKVSQTDVAVGYIDNKVNKKLLNNVLKKLKSIDIPALTMGEKSLEEVLINKKWYNPMPVFRVTERPESVAAHLIEGHIVLMVDTSPTALIIPSTLLYFTHYVEDYYQAPLVGTITRLVRILSIFTAHLLVPLFMLIVAYPKSDYNLFKFLLPESVGEITIFAQIVFVEFWLEVLQLSSLHTPTNTESAFTIIGSLILGNYAIDMGLLVPDSILFAVSSAICNHCIPNPELANAVRIFRWILILATGFFKIYGFIIAWVIEMIIIATTKTLDKGYLWPLIPFKFKALKHFLIRYPLAKFEKK